MQMEDGILLIYSLKNNNTWALSKGLLSHSKKVTWGFLYCSLGSKSSN